MCPMPSQWEVQNTHSQHLFNSVLMSVGNFALCLAGHAREVESAPPTV